MVEAVTLVNTVTGEKIEINMDDGPYFTEYVDWGQVESSNQSYKYVDQIGMHITGTTLETRQVSIAGWIANEKEYEVQKLKKILNTFVNPKQMIEVHYEKYKLNVHPSRTVVYAPTYKDNNSVICHFLILGLCSDPLFSLSKDKVITNDSTSGLFKFPFAIRKEGIVLSRVVDLGKMNAINEGDIETGMVIEFKAFGRLSNPKIYNFMTGEFIRINKVMAMGERIIINTNNGEKKIRGIVDGVETNFYRYRDLNSSWLKLRIGENVFGYEVAEGEIAALLNVKIRYSDKFLEVQT